MKRQLTLSVIILFLLSSCTLLLPAMMDVRIDSVEHQDLETLVIYLRNAEDGYQVKVGDYLYDCSRLEDDPEIVACTGPGFAPGEDLVIKFYEGDDPEPVAELTFVAPAYPEELLDTDGDGVSNAEDLCPADPNKDVPGICGCGAVETDSDRDGTPDCADGCPGDPDQVSPGENGCQSKENIHGSEIESDPASGSDSDQDGIPDSEEQCPEDPDKTEPGECGCGVPDTDTDGDGVPDCTDECVDSFSDPIGDPCDHDEDNDGLHDFADLCPLNPDKTDPGYCGCDYPETDRDGDGTPDCADKCPDDPKKVEPGECGCGTKDKDSDGDGVANCNDACPLDPNDPVGDPCDHDEDCDGCDDWTDECPFDKLHQLEPCGPPVSLCS